jgi:hypothetical protein
MRCIRNTEKGVLVKGVRAMRRWVVGRILFALKYETKEKPK